MKKILSLVCTLIMGAGTYLHAQTPAVKKTSQSVFTLTTFDKTGNIVGMSHGVFTGSQGEAMAMWTPFVGADSAVVTDSKGVTMAVEALLGVNDIYDICKFRVKGKTVPVAINMEYTGASTVPDYYDVSYSIDGNKSVVRIYNR